MKAQTARRFPKAKKPRTTPRVFARALENERDGYGEKDFAKAMERLFSASKIASVDYGRKGDERKKIRKTESAEAVK